MTNATTDGTTTATKNITLQCQFCLTWNRVDAARAADRPKCGKCSKPMLLDRPVKLTEESFDRTINESQVPVLVDFYADWCGPCKMMAPFVDEIARDYIGRALVAKLDTDHAPELSRRLQIRGIPLLMVFKDGKAVANQTGAGPKKQIEELLRKAL